MIAESFEIRDRRNPLGKGVRIRMLTSYKEINQDLIANGLPPNDLSQIPESYWKGELDGKTNLDPVLPEDWEYWSGYCQGNREYWCKQKGITLPEEF